MDKSTFIQSVDDTIKLKMEVADKYVKETIEKIGDIGSPEKLIKKPYEEWTPEDLRRLAGVYGPGDDSPLAKKIFEKSYAEVKALEREA